MTSKKQDITTGIAIIVLTALVTSVVWAGYSQNDSINKFESLANEFAEEQKDRPDYNCVNASIDFQKILKENGIDSVMITRCPEEFKTNRSVICHRWLRIDFEPQTARFVDYSKEYPEVVE